MVSVKDNELGQRLLEVAFWVVFFAATLAMCGFFAVCGLVRKLFWPVVAIVVATCIIVGVCQRCSAQDTVGAQRTEEKWFVSFVGLPGCPPCRHFERDLRTNPRLRSTIGAQSVSHWTYGTQECTDHFKNIELKSFPTFVFQPPGSNKPYIATGYTDAEELIRSFERFKAEHGAQSEEKEIKPRDHPLLHEASQGVLNRLNPLANAVEKLKNNSIFWGIGFVMGLILGCCLQNLAPKSDEA